MLVQLPSSLNRAYMYRLLDRVIDADSQPIDSEVIFDFGTLSFIEPVGVTVLGNVTEWLLKREVKVRFQFPQHYTNPLRYLDDSLFFERYLGKKHDRAASPRSTTIPLQTVAYQSSHQWMENRLITWLAQRLNVTRQSLVDIKTCFEEIFNNINDHSNENIGCIFAQHYPQLDQIKIAVSDFGVGIPYTMAARYGGLTDEEAILKASHLGVSSYSTPQNRGAGLGVLINNVVQGNKGSVYIHSNHGILSCNNNNGEINRSTQSVSSFYPGTLLEVVLRTDTIEDIVDNEEEFEW